MGRRFLVLGSNSFSGAHFVSHLLVHGHEVLGVSRSEEPHEVFLPYKWLPAGQGGFVFERIDLNHDLDRLMELVCSYQPTHVVNFAAQSMVAQSWETPEHWYQTNVLAQVRFHDRLRTLDSLEKYVHVSTPEVYGTTDGRITENFEFSPSTPYAVSRAACDLHLRSFHKAYGFPVVFTRAANVYGPGQQLYRIIPRAMLFARTGRRLQLDGGGHSIRSFIYIDDVADATRRVALDGTPGASYHVSTASEVSVRELIERICSMMRVPFGDLVDVSDDRLGKDQAYLLDTMLIRDELGWSDQTDLEKGLAMTLGWIDAQLSLLSQFPDDYEHKQ